MVIETLTKDQVEKLYNRSMASVGSMLELVKLIEELKKTPEGDDCLLTYNQPVKDATQLIRTMAAHVKFRLERLDTEQ